ncbi:hypothetical protein [Bacillus sp. B1-b2]|uniref:hypothetical protein n=1 Tax=Bacillus sp. B1-b2 TaxID=2653201 RepID=UPI001261CAF8|nr:hypothetical protein [Bacillus sp. B1-b2]KAB7663024.1 hypothetical protein F9279_24325 [Bacillus sp. B1-b2]
MIHMENEEITVDQQADEEIVSEEITTTEEVPTTSETVVQTDDTEITALLEQIHETQLYGFGVQMMIFGLLFFVLFFTGMKAGKGS